MTKAHVLFPILDYTARAQHQLDIRLNKIEKDVALIKSAVEEMHTLQKEQAANSFNLKESGYMVCLSIVYVFQFYMHIVHCNGASTYYQWYTCSGTRTKILA